MESKIDIFSKKKLKNSRDKLAVRNSANHFLFNEINKRLAERLLLIKKNFFKTLELGSRTGATLKNLPKEKKIENFFFTDISHKMLVKAKKEIKFDKLIKKKVFINLNEESLPFKEKTFDLVISNLYLHWSNNIVGSLSEINRILKPDGLFLASFFGDETLKELKYSLYSAESDLTNQATPRVSPFLTMQQIGSLLQNVGFNLPVVDKDIIKFFYKDLFDLMHDIKLMGETNNLLSRKKSFTSKKILQAANKIYKRDFSAKNKIYATYDILYLIGWKKHPSQQKPKKPGSATQNFSEFLS